MQITLPCLQNDSTAWVTGWLLVSPPTKLRLLSYIVSIPPMKNEIEAEALRSPSYPCLRKRIFSSLDMEEE